MAFGISISGAYYVARLAHCPWWLAEAAHAKSNVYQIAQIIAAASYQLRLYCISSSIPAEIPILKRKEIDKRVVWRWPVM